MEEKYLLIVSEILNHPEFQKRKNYLHHENESVYDHSLKVSYLGYRIAKKINLKYSNDVAIAGLLHDFYKESWQDNKNRKKFFQQHGFVHAKEARDNAYRYFSHLMNNRVEDMILKHMFPLNIKPPKYIGSWIITVSDKLVSLSIFRHPTKLPKYIGIKKRRKK